MERWGFPFLGAIWHPHVTIASIRPPDWGNVWPKLAADPPSGTVRFPSLDRMPWPRIAPCCSNAYPRDVTMIGQVRQAPSAWYASSGPGQLADFRGAIPKRGDFDSTIRSCLQRLATKLLKIRDSFNFAGKIHLLTTVSGESSVSENLAPDALEN